MQTARAIIFDVRKAGISTAKLITLADALYEASILSHAGRSSNFAFLTLVLIGGKGYELLLDVGPLIDKLDTRFKRAFGKLKQLIRIPSHDAIFSSQNTLEHIILEDVISHFKEMCTGFGNTFLEIMFITATEERILRKELEIVFNKCDCVQLNKLLVAHLNPSEDCCNEMNYWSHLNKLVWHQDSTDGKIEQIFKSWLSLKRKDWTLEIGNKGGRCAWSTIVDIEDVILDLNGWPDSSSTNCQQMSNLGVFHDGRSKTLRIVRWVRNDGVPAWLLHGMPRRISPACGTTQNKELSKTNKEKYSSLFRWLEKESLVAIAQLMPCEQGTDFFSLAPVSDGSLLMRNVPCRELLLPPSTNQFNVNKESNSEMTTPNTEFCEEIFTAFYKLPSYTSALQSDEMQQRSVIKAIESEILANFSFGGRKGKANASRSRRAPR